MRLFKINDESEIPNYPVTVQEKADSRRRADVDNPERDTYYDTYYDTYTEELNFD